jgi:phospholipid/cholesterol/gamma-HCH transport system substrate-binding protein
VTLAILVFLMSGTNGLFTTKITLVTYFDNAEGLRAGQPVDLQGTPIGNVKSVSLIPGRPLAPVQVTLRISKQYGDFVHKDSTAMIKTAGVLGESYIDVDSRQAKLGPAKDGDELQSANSPGLDDVVRASQGTLQNVDILVKRLDRILASVETGKGTLGEFINDPSFFNRATAILNQVQGLLNDVNAGKGTVGKLFADDSLYRKANEAVDKLDRMISEVDQGKGNLGKLVKDDALYNNANQTMAKANKLMDDLNSGHGAAGKLLKDEEFAAKLKNTISKLSAITDRLEAGEGTAGRLLKDPSIYNNTDQMLIETRNLVKAIRENPKKYLTIHFKIF